MTAYEPPDDPGAATGSARGADGSASGAAVAVLGGGAGAAGVTGFAPGAADAVPGEIPRTMPEAMPSVAHAVPPGGVREATSSVAHVVLPGGMREAPPAVTPAVLLSAVPPALPEAAADGPPGAALDALPTAVPDPASGSAQGALPDATPAAQPGVGLDVPPGSDPDARPDAGADVAPSAGLGAAPSTDPDIQPGTSPDIPHDAIVLAGGAARRLGGADKPGLRVGGRALLDRVLGACADAGTTVVVADPRPTARPVRWAREEPPGAGPVAALDAGLRHTTAEAVVVLSADLPFLEVATVRRLLTALRTSGAEGVLLTDADGRDQPLVAAYRASALRRELAALTDAASISGSAAGGGLTGLPLRRLTAALELTRVPDPVASFDCDTWDDLATARARIREHGHVLDEWISAVKDELGIDLDVDTGTLLDLARDAAHGVARPAAPLTTFLVGYAAAQGKGGPEAVAEAARKAVALALRWADEDTPQAPSDAKADTKADAPSGAVSAAKVDADAPASAPGPDTAG